MLVKICRVVVGNRPTSSIRSDDREKMRICVASREELDHTEGSLVDNETAAKFGGELVLIGGNDSRDFLLRSLEDVFTPAVTNEVTLKGHKRNNTRKFSFMGSALQKLIFSTVQDQFIDTSKRLEDVCASSFRNRARRYRESTKSGSDNEGNGSVQERVNASDETEETSYVALDDDSNNARAPRSP